MLLNFAVPFITGEVIRSYGQIFTLYKAWCEKSHGCANIAMRADGK